MAMQINASACLSPLPCEKNPGYRIRKHEISKKAKISKLAFPMYTSKLMCSNNNSQFITKSVVSLEKDYKIPLYPSKICQLFSFHIYAKVKTLVIYR